jgi:hypothetical protein
VIEGDFQAPNWLDLQHLHHSLLEGLASKDAERVAGNKMALNAECIVDGGLNGQEALR